MTGKFPDAGPVLAAVVTVAGALAGERLGPGPGWGTALAACLALAGALVLARGARPAAVVASACAGSGSGTAAPACGGTGPGRTAALGLLGLGLLAATSMQRALDGLGGPVAGLAGRREPAVVAARLADDPRSRWREGRVPARLEAIRAGDGDDDGAGSTRTRRSRARVLVVAREATAMRLRLLGAGEEVVISGRLRPLDPVEHGWRWRHVAAVLEADDLLAARAARPPVLAVANRLRALVLQGSAPLPSTPRALVAGFLVGDDRDLPPKVAEDFRAAGLSHLLAVSGANVALALTLAGPVLRRRGLVGRLAGGVAVLGLFAAMTRFEPSVLRASAMTGLSLLAGFVGRPASGIRLLALAGGALVLADPFLVHSIGFRLSCCASAGIVLLARPLAIRLPGPSFVRQSLAVTGAAQAGVAPVLLPAFGDLPLVALPANLAVAPAAAVLTVWGLGSGLVGGLVGGWWPAAAAMLQVPTGAMAGYIAGVAAVAGRFPVAVTPGQAKAAAVLGAAALFVRRARRGRPWRPGARPGPARRAAGGREQTAPGR